MKPAVEFWSSTEGAAFQQAQVRELVAAGWPANLKHEVPQSDYWTARSRLVRLVLRLRTYGVYPARLALRFWRRRAGGIAVVCTNTFYAPWVVLKTARREVRVVHWVFDLFPGVLVAAGALRSGGLGERLLRRMMRTTFDRAAANVFLGEHLRRHAEEEFGAIPRSHVIPVGADGTPFRERPPQPRAAGVPIRILYCGNLGRMHDTETVIAVAQAGLPVGIDLEFRGNGTGFIALEEALQKIPQVALGANLPEAEWASAMCAADVALVTVRPGAEGLVMPSKTYSALVAGQAILAVCPLSCDLADLVRKHEVGWVVVPGDSEAFKAALHDMTSNHAALLGRRQRAWRAGHEHYDQRILAERWSSLFEAIDSSYRRPGQTW